MEDILLYFSLKYHGQFDLIYKALERKERVDESLKKELKKKPFLKKAIINTPKEILGE